MLDKLYGRTLMPILEEEIRWLTQRGYSFTIPSRHAYTAA